MKEQKKDILYLLLLTLLGTLLRLDVLVANNFVIDSDEAIVGIMARDILAGKGIPTFYYGQHYMGSLEALITAGMFQIFGDSAIVLKIVPLLFSLALIWLVYALAFNAGGKTCARFASLLCAFPASALVIWSSMARGGFIEIVVIGASAFLLLQYWLKSRRENLKLVLGIGLLLGLGWWVNNQILYFMIPTALVMLGKILWLRDSDALGKLITLTKTVFTGLFAWLVGSLPYWAYNIANAEHCPKPQALGYCLPSLGMFEPAKVEDSWKYLGGLYDTALPILLGGSRFWQADNVFPGSKACIALVFFSLFAAFLVARWRQLTSMFILRFDSERCLELFFLLVVACILIFVSSSFGWLYQAPRYLLPMYVGIFVLSGFSLDLIFRKSKLIAFTLLGLLLFCNFASMYWGGRSIPGEPYVFHGDRVSKDHSELISWLRQNDVHWIRTNYWIGYRLAFETKGDVRFIVNQEPNQTRIASWPEEAKHIPKDQMPMVMVPTQARIIRHALSILHYTYEEVVLSGYHVFYKIEQPHPTIVEIPSSELRVSSALNSTMAANAIDGTDQTRWGSGQPQAPGMQFTISLETPSKLKALRYDLGTWPQDFPRGLQIEFEKANGERILYFDSQGWEAVRYFLQMQSVLTFYVPEQEVSKVILTQTKRHGIFDWSIAEIKLYR